MAERETEEKLPALDSPKAWLKIAGILILLVLINAVVFLVSYGFGVIVTIPLTLFLAFLVIRDLVPRHRLPPGRRPEGLST